MVETIIVAGLIHSGFLDSFIPDVPIDEIILERNNPDFYTNFIAIKNKDLL